MGFVADLLMKRQGLDGLLKGPDSPEQGSNKPQIRPKTGVGVGFRRVELASYTHSYPPATSSLLLLRIKTAGKKEEYLERAYVFIVCNTLYNRFAFKTNCNRIVMTFTRGVLLRL